MINYDYLYDKSYFDKFIKINHFSTRKLHWREYANATVLPFMNGNPDMAGGLVDENGDYVDGSSLHMGFGNGYKFSDSNRRESDETVVLLGLWPNIWGHWLTDNIRRLWVLQDEEFMKKYGKLKFIYIRYGRHKIGRNASELLKILGVEGVQLIGTKELVKYKKVILPDECFFRTPDTNRYYTKEYVQLIDTIRQYALDNYKDTGIRKVYYTYRRYSDIRAMGEYRLEGFFKRLGYEIISPEQYSLKEQFNILLSCNEFASTVGSAAHSVVFLNEGTKVFLIPRLDSINEYQIALNQIISLDVTYIDSTLSLYLHPEHPWGGPFYFIISDNLLRAFGKKMKRRNNNRGFAIYRQLGYWLNGCQKPGDYYSKEYPKYLDMPSDWIENYSILHKRIEKITVQRKVSNMLVKLMSFLARLRPYN